MLNHVTIVGNVRRFKRKDENGVLYKQLVMNALSKMKIREVVSPLGNEFVLDDKWLLEMDRDGAFAVIVSPVDRLDGDYSASHKLVCFSHRPEEDFETMQVDIYEKVQKAINSLHVAN